MAKSSPLKTAILFIFLIILVVGLSLFSNRIWGGKRVSPTEANTLVIEQEMTMSQFGKANDLSNAEKINADFKSYENFCDQLKNAGLTQFGSGWAWLVLKNNTLEIMKTSNADTPIAQGFKPVLTVDVWEHAYYLDYQNGRGNYIDAFITNLINWEFANSNLL